MRIGIVGSGLSANAIRTFLGLAHVPVVAAEADYTIIVGECHSAIPVVDGIDSEWERCFINTIAKDVNTDILLKRIGGVQSDNCIEILFPIVAPELYPALEKAIGRAVLQMLTPVLFPPPAPQTLPTPPPLVPAKPWYKRLLWD